MLPPVAAAEIHLPIVNSYWVERNRLLAGEYPGSADPETTRRRLDAFIDAGIDTFIDLTEKHELEPYESILTERADLRGMQAVYKRHSIVDFATPSRGLMAAALDDLDAALAAGRRVYVHCWGGVGRTGTTVGCYLVRHGMTGAQAVRQIAAWWQDVPKRVYHPRSPQTDEQVRYVLDWDAGT